MPWSTEVTSYQISYAVTPRTVRRSETDSLSIAKLTVTTILNFLLVGIALTLLVAYVLNANGVAANQYLLKSLDEQAVSLSDERMSLALEREALQEAELLMTVAQSQGMVETAEISYIFESNNVAYQK